MSGQVQFYVNRVHSIGGVTTWSFQAASFLADRYRTRVVSVNTGAHGSDEWFPGQVMEVWRNASDAPHSDCERDSEPRTSRPTKPTKPVKPTKKTKKPKKSTKPEKPTKPTKKPIEPPPLFPEENKMSAENRPNDRPVGRDRFPFNGGSNSHTRTLHRSAEVAIEQADLFIPNYLDFAFELAARSRAQGNASRCIGICHCDQENYYRLLTHYAPIIHSFIAVSPRCMKKLIECLPTRALDIHLVPYGVELPATVSPQQRCGPIRLLYAGRLARKQKRIFDLVEIVRQLNRRKVDYWLDIVGSGPDRESLMDAFDGASRVRFYPGVPHTEIAQVYRDHDVFLLPSETEGTSIALLESMGHGLVPVATRVSGSEDVVLDRVNGFLAEVGDVARMADRIALLAENRAMLRQLAKRARATVSGNYRIDAQLGAFEQCVQQTLLKPLVPVEVARSVLRQDA